MNNVGWVRSGRLLIVLALLTLFAAEHPVDPANAGVAVKLLAPHGIFDTRTAGVELWHDYGAFALYRVDDSLLQQLPPKVRQRIRSGDQLDRIELAGGGFNPLSNGAARSTISADGPALQLVQFVGPIKQSWLEQLETHKIRPLHAIKNNAYLVWADDGGRAKLAEWVQSGDFLQYSDLYQPQFKLGATLSSAARDATPLAVTVQMVDHRGKQATENLIASLALAVQSDWQPILSYQNLKLTVPATAVSQIAAQPDVVWIGAQRPRELYDEVQTQIMAGALTPDRSGPAAAGYLAWLDSLGFSQNASDYPIVDIVDDGIGNGVVGNGAGDSTLTRLGDGVTTRLAYLASCASGSNGGGPDGHGHINVSIAGGYDSRSGFPFTDPNGYLRGQGVNPYGRFAGTRIFAPNFNLNACGGSDTGLIQSQQNSGAKISSNSWGCSSCANQYDDSSQAFDVGTRDADLNEAGNQEMIMVFAAGNSGPGATTVGSPGNGKNVITVGASENQRPSDEDGNWNDGCQTPASEANDAMDVVAFSSRGPSPGSRIKPDIIAPGTHIQGTASTHNSYNGSGVCDQFRPSQQTTFAASSGTSHSTPAIAGVLSLYDYWLSQQYGVSNPSPALLKAYLIAHPTYLDGVAANDDLPSNSQGYGMPNMAMAFDDTPRQIVEQGTPLDTSGESWQWSGAVADPSKPLRIVLSYTDKAGALGGSPQVNDLDLSATVDGVELLGNVFNGAWSTSGGSADDRNNVEAIFLPAGTEGTVNITVTGSNIADDGVPNQGDATDQDFALVCYNCSATSTFVLSAEPQAQAVCAPEPALFNVSADPVFGFSDSISFSSSGAPAGATVVFEPAIVTPPAVVTLTISNTLAAAAGSYQIAAVAVHPTQTQTVTLGLDLVQQPPAASQLQSPADGATGVATQPLLSWQAAPGASSYQLEIAADADFSNIVYATAVSGVSHQPTIALQGNETYYWRVLPANVCGQQSAVTSASFTTVSGSLACNGATVDFESGIPADWKVEVATGVVAWTLTGDTDSCEPGNLTNGSGLAACADSDATNGSSLPYDTRLVTNAFSLTTSDEITLSFAGHFNRYTNESFMVDIKSNGVWNNLLTWTSDTTQSPSLDLTAYANEAVQLRFRYLGNDWDWYAQVDDVQLSCSAAPQATLAPDDINVTVATNEQLTTSLAISNTGRATLDWSIAEDQPQQASRATAPFDAAALLVDHTLTPAMAAFAADREDIQLLQPQALTPCVGGMAGSYPCSNIDLLSFLPLANIGGGGNVEGADIWGWTDSQTGKEYALMALTNGTSFIDISDPLNPVYLGRLPTRTFNSIWRDLKVYSDHAFIVSEASSHGMQIFDLTQLRNVASPPQTFSADANYTLFSNAHNIVINEASGYAYAVGTNTCSGGLHAIDISTPTSPSSAGCIGSDGYTHDAQCINYDGPDPDHAGSEICFAYNEDTLTIYDVTNKSSPVQLSRTGYAGNSYSHQGWVTDDLNYLLLDDETDEQSFGHNTRTYMWDISDLDLPVMFDVYTGPTAAIDHNQYIKGRFSFQANYRSGLRILDIGDIANGNLTEFGYFDIYPSNDSANFNGAWSVYPYFDSGAVIVSGIEQGLFVLEPAFTCVAPNDVPWLSVAPSAGSVAPESSDTVAVVFDATGLDAGDYEALLCVTTNDSDNALVRLSVTMTVEGVPTAVALQQARIAQPLLPLLLAFSSLLAAAALLLRRRRI